MKAQGQEGRESYLDESQADTEQDCEDDGLEGFTTPECGVVVPPPSHVMCERALQLEKQRENVLQWNPGSRRLADTMLLDVVRVLQPTKEQQDARRSVIQYVDSFVKQRIHGSRITVFGSHVMNLYTGSSDLDLSLNVGDLPVDRSRADKIMYLRKLTRVLHGLHNGRQGVNRLNVRKIEPIMRAAVPVVKFVEGYTNIECDISMENRDGVLKSELVGIFTQIDPRFPQLCFLLKAWAKAYNVNDSKKGTLNSLSLILLVAFHLQTRSPAILPSFSALLEGLVLRETENCIAAVKERVALYVRNCFGRDNKETLSQLFGSFFTKFVAVESLWEQGLCVSVYEGKWVSKVWAKNHFGCMSVEDFAERSQNCARAVREKEFDIIYQSFRDTLRHLNHFSGSSSEILEIKQKLFGVRSLKRTSEEPLVQPVEKHSRVAIDSANAMSNRASYVGPDRANGYPVADSHGIPHTRHAVYSNNNGDLNFSRHQRSAAQAHQWHLRWAGRGESIQAAGRGILSPVPGGQVPHFAEPSHEQMWPRIGSQPFPQQTRHPEAAYRGYNSQADARPFSHPGRGMGPRGVPAVVGPLLYPPHLSRPQMYYPEPSGYSSDVRDPQQSSNWGYNQGAHASQAFDHRNYRS